MTRHRPTVGFLAVVFGLAAGALSLGVQAQAPASRTSSASHSSVLARTPDGHPDFQGVWANNTVTPFERPAALSGQEFFTDKELAILKQRAAQLFGGVGDIAPGDELFLALLSNEQEHKSPRAVGDYNQVWDADELVFERRTSQVIDPADGLLPPLTPEGAQKQASIREARRLHAADGPESRTLLERCLTKRYHSARLRADSLQQLLSDRANTGIRSTSERGAARGANRQA